MMSEIGGGHATAYSSSPSSDVAKGEIGMVTSLAACLYPLRGPVPTEHVVGPAAGGPDADLLMLSPSAGLRASGRQARNAPLTWLTYATLSLCQERSN